MEGVAVQEAADVSAQKQKRVSTLVCVCVSHQSVCVPERVHVR